MLQIESYAICGNQKNEYQASQIAYRRTNTLCPIHHEAERLSGSDHDAFVAAGIVGMAVRVSGLRSNNADLRLSWVLTR